MKRAVFGHVPGTVVALIRTQLTGGFVQAVLTGPIVTDDAPAVKPPWAVLAFTFCLLALAMPREVLPEFCVASVVVAVGAWVVNQWFTKTPSPLDDASDG